MMNRIDSSKRVAIPLLQTLLLVLPRHAFVIVSIVSVSLVISVLYALFIYNEMEMELYEMELWCVSLFTLAMRSWQCSNCGIFQLKQI